MTELHLSEEPVAEASLGEELSLLAPAASGSGAVVLAPSERVLTLVVDLPLPSHAQRLAALPFAVEETVAEPIEDLHMALGAEVAPGRYLAGMVRHEHMLRWVEQMAAAGLGRAALTPDALALPRPAEGAWSLRLSPTRALVRTGEGPGFALPAAMLRTAWEAAGRPTTASYGDPPTDAEILVSPGLELTPAAVAPRLALDLRQGVYAAVDSPLRTALRRIAMIAAIGLSAHLVIQVADLLMLRHDVSVQRAQTEALARQTLPGVPLSENLVADLEPLLSTRGGGDRSAFFPLLTRATAAVAPFAATSSVQEIAFSAADGALRMKVDSSDIAGLQRLDAALRSAGLTSTPGAASAQDGRATGEILVRDAASTSVTP